jgi:hypothetical protein
MDGVNITSALILPNTGSYSVWQTVSARANLMEGKHVLRVVVDSGGFNFNRIDISKTNDLLTVATPTITPNGGSFSGPVQVSLQTATPGATIYYTTNGATPTTGSTRYTPPLTLTASATVKAFAVVAGYYDSAVASASFTISPSNQQPYGGKLWLLPGTLEAENYDLGGEASAYHDTTVANSGGKYRTDRVDIWYASDPAVGYYVGATVTGEWLEYSVDVKTAGQYSLTFSVATPNSGRKLHVELDGVNVTGAVTLLNTGSYSVWQTVSATANLMSAGKHVLRVAVDLGGFNFNRIVIN